MIKVKAVKAQYFRSLFDAFEAIVNFKQIGFKVDRFWLY